jgi:hypothetical protein
LKIVFESLNVFFLSGGGIMVISYKKFSGEVIHINVPVITYGDTRGNRPSGADLRPWGVIPEGYELLTSYEGWESGDCEFLAPMGSKFVQTIKGSPHHCGSWECTK